MRSTELRIKPTESPPLLRGGSVADDLQRVADVVIHLCDGIEPLANHPAAFALVAGKVIEEGSGNNAGKRIRFDQDVNAPYAFLEE